MKIHRFIDNLEIHLKKGTLFLLSIALFPVVIVGYLVERLKRLGN